MGNSHCVPQTPRRLRASFSRKPSLKGNREDSARKLAGLFGTEARPDGDTAANKIFHYIPGTQLGVTPGQLGGIQVQSKIRKLTLFLSRELTQKSRLRVKPRPALSQC